MVILQLYIPRLLVDAIVSNLPIQPAPFKTKLHSPIIRSSLANRIGLIECVELNEPCGNCDPIPNRSNNVTILGTQIRDVLPICTFSMKELWYSVQTSDVFEHMLLLTQIQQATDQPIRCNVNLFFKRNRCAACAYCT